MASDGAARIDLPAVTRSERRGPEGRRSLTVEGTPVELDVPSTYRHGRPAPLAISLHGAGASPAGPMRFFRRTVEEAGLIVAAPKSAGTTWDVIRGGFGPDVDAIERLLAWLMERYTIDPARIALTGFSDGASYALSLGLSNGDVFTHLIAFSPGFVASAERRGRPRIFVSHGTADGTLPIDRTSRRLVPDLEDDGYDVRYEEYAGGHEVPETIATEAFRWFLG